MPAHEKVGAWRRPPRSYWWCPTGGDQNSTHSVWQRMSELKRQRRASLPAAGANPAGVVKFTLYFRRGTESGTSHVGQHYAAMPKCDYDQLLEFEATTRPGGSLRDTSAAIGASGLCSVYPPPPCAAATDPPAPSPRSRHTQPSPSPPPPPPHFPPPHTHHEEARNWSSTTSWSPATPRRGTTAAPRSSGWCR